MNTLDEGFHQLGLGTVLQGLLKVPPNQRPYAWEESQVEDYLQDLELAMSEGADEYFMGTVVLVQDKDALLIADGQQRLATTAITLARIRDLLNSIGADRAASAIENDCLKTYVREYDSEKYLLTLNVEDAQYFRETVVSKDWIQDDGTKPSSQEPSNARLYEASAQILKFLSSRVDGSNDGAAKSILNAWATYVIKQAKTVVVVVASEVGAYRMFETLNDRGLRASQIDILKNYFFSKVEEHQLDQMKGSWSSIHSALVDHFDNPDEQMLRYIKYVGIKKYGLIRDKDLASTLKEQNKSGTKALEFVSEAASLVHHYVALFNSSHISWKGHSSSTRHELDVLTKVINIEQILPLAFAVACEFPKVELAKALRLFVVWSVRLRLGGSGRAGRLDKQYADLAHDVGTKKKTKASELRSFLKDKVPNDVEFERSASSAKVKQPSLARYYLSEIEHFLYPGTGEKMTVSDVTKVNLEHIVPRTYRADLEINKLDHGDLIHRLGNLTIFKADWNREAENRPFKEKQSLYQNSEIEITKALCNLDSFKRAEIDTRQANFAEVATKIWSTKFGS